MEYYILHTTTQSIQSIHSGALKPHLDAALHVIRYLKGNQQNGLFFPVNNGSQVSAYCDSDWAVCPSSGKSLTGFCIFLGSFLISWKIKNIQRSTDHQQKPNIEVWPLPSVNYSGFHTFSETCKSISSFPSIFTGNKAIQHIAANLVFHERMKHLEIDCHIVHNQITRGFIYTHHVPLRLQLANIFTKPLGTTNFYRLFFKMRLPMFFSSSSCGASEENKETSIRKHFHTQRSQEPS